MTQPEQAAQQLTQLSQLIQGVAKNFVHRLYSTQGPQWETPFDDIEELAVQTGKAIALSILDQALDGQASSPVPVDWENCGHCGKPLQLEEPEPRILTTRAGDVQWNEPKRFCQTCRKSFFPSVQELGH